MLAVTSKLRRIEPLALPTIERATSLGKKPELKWVKPTDLMVDECYQRDLTNSSIGLIGRMVREFSWAKMKPPVAVAVGRAFHVIDGQHTAIAAASLDIESIPVFVVGADDIVERASAFVSHNRNRIAISQLQIHRALYAAGEDTAVEMQKVCDKIGVTLRALSRTSAINIGDTASVATIRRIVDVHGPMRARQALEACVQGKRAPIGEAEILAAFDIISGAKNDVVESLARAIRIEGDEGVLRAKAQGQMARTQAWRCLAAIYRKRMSGKAQ